MLPVRGCGSAPAPDGCCSGGRVSPHGRLEVLGGHPGLDQHDPATVVHGVHHAAEPPAAGLRPLGQQARPPTRGRPAGRSPSSAGHPRPARDRPRTTPTARPASGCPAWTSSRRPPLQPASYRTFVRTKTGPTAMRTRSDELRLWVEDPYRTVCGRRYGPPVSRLGPVHARANIGEDREFHRLPRSARAPRPDSQTLGSVKRSCPLV